MAQWIDLNQYSPDDPSRVGEVGFLIRSVHNGVERFHLQAKPGYTNRSFEPKVTGWLGETDNVSRFACGVRRIVRVGKRGDRIQVAQVTPDVRDALCAVNGIEVES